MKWPEYLFSCSAYFLSFIWFKDAIESAFNMTVIFLRANTKTVLFETSLSSEADVEKRAQTFPTWRTLALSWVDSLLMNQQRNFVHSSRPGVFAKVYASTSLYFIHPIKKEKKHDIYCKTFREIVNWKYLNRERSFHVMSLWTSSSPTSAHLFCLYISFIYHNQCFENFSALEEKIR